MTLAELGTQLGSSPQLKKAFFSAPGVGQALITASHQIFHLFTEKSPFIAIYISALMQENKSGGATFVYDSLRQ